MAEWQPIDSRYEVSRIGEVRRIGGPVLKQWKSGQGYSYVRLSQPRRQKRVHRLVAEAFVPNPDGKPFVNHLNNNRSDNRAENLEWCTQWENIAHARAQDRMYRHPKNRRSANAYLTDEQVREIRALYAAGGHSHESIGRQYGVSKRSVGRCIVGESYADVR